LKKRLPRNSNPLPATSNQNTYAYGSPGTPPSGSYASPQVGVSGSQPVIPPKKSKPLLLYGIISGVALLFLVATLIVGGILIRSLNAQAQTIPTENQNAVAAVSTQGPGENNPEGKKQSIDIVFTYVNR
jgi:Na+/proline symporter